MNKQTTIPTNKNKKQKTKLVQVMTQTDQAQAIDTNTTHEVKRKGHS